VHISRIGLAASTSSGGINKVFSHDDFFMPAAPLPTPSSD
jgi:hypothetical protein